MKVTSRNYKEAMSEQIVATNKSYTVHDMQMIKDAENRGELLDVAISLGRTYKAVAQARYRMKKMGELL